MRAHTITTSAHTIAPPVILALSLAAVLVAATAKTAGAEQGPTAPITGNGVITPTTPTQPLTLALHAPQLRAKKFTFRASTNHDSRLVAGGGGVMKTTKRLVAGEVKKIKAKLKRPKALHKWPTSGGVFCQRKTLKITATDEFGQTATGRLPVTTKCYG